MKSEKNFKDFVKISSSSHIFHIFFIIFPLKVLKVLCLAAAWEAERLVTGMANGTLRLWSIKTRPEKLGAIQIYDIN